MNTFFSPSTKGFYIDGTHSSMPSDVVPFDEDSWLALLGQAALLGKEIAADGDGFPTLVDPVVLVSVPTRVTMRQAKEALILAGLDDDVEIALNAIQDPIQKKLALCQWRESNEMHRNMPLVQQISGALGLSEQAIDDLFVEAAKR